MVQTPASNNMLANECRFIIPSKKSNTDSITPKHLSSLPEGCDPQTWSRNFQTKEKPKDDARKVMKKRHFPHLKQRE